VDSKYYYGTSLPVTTRYWSKDESGKEVAAGCWAINLPKVKRRTH